MQIFPPIILYKIRALGRLRDARNAKAVEPAIRSMLKCDDCLLAIIPSNHYRAGLFPTLLNGYASCVDMQITFDIMQRRLNDSKQDASEWL